VGLWVYICVCGGGVHSERGWGQESATATPYFKPACSRPPLFPTHPPTHRQAATLSCALRHFTAPEVLDGDNRYRCPANGELVRALKSITIEEAPNVLAVHLKRFDFFGRGEWGEAGRGAVGVGGARARGAYGAREGLSLVHLGDCSLVSVTDL